MHEDLKADTVKLKPNQKLHVGYYTYVHTPKRSSIDIYKGELLQSNFAGTVTAEFTSHLHPEAQKELDSIFQSQG